MKYELSFLTESGSGKKIAVNPLLVRLIIEIDDEEVAIVFDHGHQIRVDGTVAMIAEQLAQIHVGDVNSRATAATFGFPLRRKGRRRVRQNHSKGASFDPREDRAYI